MRRGPFHRLALAASLVFIADFATKQWALRTLENADRPFAAGWHLTIINNTHLAGGLQSGGLELPFTALLTIVVAALVIRICRQMAAVDPGAPLTFGLLLGAGAANLADSLLPPRGVVDFIAFTGSNGDTMSFNVADVVLVVGLVLCVRATWRIAQAMQGRIVRGRQAHDTRNSGAFPMRDRVLVSAGHALLAMCAFVWLYSMAIAFTPDAGRSAPNSLLCGVGVFAVAFLASQARMRMIDRRIVSDLHTFPARSVERVVLDGSIPVAPLTDLSRERPGRSPHGDTLPSNDRPAPTASDVA